MATVLSTYFMDDVSFLSSVDVRMQNVSEHPIFAWGKGYPYPLVGKGILSLFLKKMAAIQFYSGFRGKGYSSPFLGKKEYSAAFRGKGYLSPFLRERHPCSFWGKGYRAHSFPGMAISMLFLKKIILVSIHVESYPPLHSGERDTSLNSTLSSVDRSSRHAQ